jgi:nucleoside 2-deoxyribosyltransferase
MKLYLAGPMRGLPAFNFPAFNEAAALLRAAGHEVFSPADRDSHVGFDPTGMAGTDAELDRAHFSVREALGADLGWICAEADAIALLDGWERSLGTAAEVATARALGLPVYTLGELVDAEVRSFRGRVER